MPTQFDHAGGEAGLHRLEDAFDSSVLADPVLQPLFGAGRPDHVDHLTAFTGESFGGPDRFSRELDFAHLIAVHRGLQIIDEQRQRFVELYIAALDEVGLPADEEFREAARSHVEFGSRRCRTRTPPMTTSFIPSVRSPGGTGLATMSRPRPTRTMPPGRRRQRVRRAPGRPPRARNDPLRRFGRRQTLSAVGTLSEVDRRRCSSEIEITDSGATSPQSALLQIARSGCGRGILAGVVMARWTARAASTDPAFCGPVRLLPLSVGHVVRGRLPTATSDAGAGRCHERGPRCCPLRRGSRAGVERAHR
jgi:hemoglobin